MGNSELALPKSQDEDGLPSMPSTTKNPALKHLIHEVNQEEHLYSGVANPNASLSALSNLRVGSGTMRHARKSALGKDFSMLQ